VFACMPYQMGLVNECIITQITNIRAFSTMYPLMCYQIILVIVCFITHITNIRALSTMYALMFYQMAVFTECLITNFTAIWTPTPMYIRGISAFITAYIKLFIWSNLVKTARLNIRVYFDRKNSNFYSNVYIH